MALDYRSLKNLKIGEYKCLRTFLDTRLFCRDFTINVNKFYSSATVDGAVAVKMTTPLLTMTTMTTNTKRMPPFTPMSTALVLEVDEKEVYRQFQGTHTGGLTVNVGEEIEVHAVFLDATGAEAHLDEVEAVDEHGHEEEFGLGLSDYDSSIIEIHLEHEDAHEHGEEEHDEEEHAEEEGDHEEHAEDELGFGLEGLKAGKTEIKLQLLHGDHPDFTGALLIPVTVQ